MQAVRGFNLPRNYKKDSDCWLIGRDEQKLIILGDGPSGEKGCASGITKTCAKDERKCNCSTNDIR